MTSRIVVGDCTQWLRALPSDSVQACITSPPYWGLRDYGTATWQGGDPACTHAHAKKRSRYDYAPSHSTAVTTHFRMPPGTDQARWAAQCPDCAAVRVDQQIGAEKRPDCLGWARGEQPVAGCCYVCNLRIVFREVRRVLRPDGTLWLNLGDCYTGGNGYAPNAPSNQAGSVQARRNARAKSSGTTVNIPGRAKRIPGLGNKNMAGLPWRVALALQADGWILRSDIIWHKPNAMPESVRDRPTKAHEYVLLLAKSRSYFYDEVAVREPARTGRRYPSWPERLAKGAAPRHGDPAATHDCNGAAGLGGDGATRNLRTVWSVLTRGFPGAHFAVFPPDLVRPAVKASTPQAGCCPGCGTPWRRVIDRERRANAPSLQGKYDGEGKHRTVSGGVSQDARREVLLGWTPGCECLLYNPVPSLILDPFAGAGTTLLVAQEEGREGFGIELNPEYARLARERLAEAAARR